MKAFFSHSSKDKHIVEEVAEIIGGANVEIDSSMFEHGILSVQAIQNSLSKCGLFVLFLSQDALDSKIVRFEALTAQELVARGVIEKFIVICLDDTSFRSADEHWKRFNFVRKVAGKNSIARIVQNALIIAQSKQSAASYPFVGRANELFAAKEKLIDPSVTSVRACMFQAAQGSEDAPSRKDCSRTSILT
jgi:hypothetical protein